MKKEKETFEKYISRIKVELDAKLKNIDKYTRKEKKLFKMAKKEK